jgi:hypothetical protein
VSEEADGVDIDEGERRERQRRLEIHDFQHQHRGYAWGLLWCAVSGSFGLFGLVQVMTLRLGQPNALGIQTPHDARINALAFLALATASFAAAALLVRKRTRLRRRLAALGGTPLPPPAWVGPIIGALVGSFITLVTNAIVGKK